jgi:ADP-heptose:LPS heptosyltransferase
VLAPLADPRIGRVALVRLRVGLGDLLCSMPALRALRRFRPDLHVTLITWPEVAPVVERMRGDVDELLPFPGTPGIPERPPQPQAWPGFVSAAVCRGFDLAVQCYGDNPVANAVTASVGARLVGGFAPSGWQPPSDATALHLRYPVELHEVWRHLRLVELLGVPLAERAADMEFPVGAGDQTELQALFSHHALAPGRYAVLHPGASSPTRRWPVERFAAVGDALHADGLRVVLTGVGGERSLAAAVAATMKNPATDLTGATTLGGLAALLRDAAVLVSNDTGSAHLAAAVGTRTVTVFLPGDPRRWAHVGRRHRAIAADVPCSPCPHLVCPIDFRCAVAVTPGEVVKQAREALAAEP